MGGDALELCARDWGWRHATREAWAVQGLSFRVRAGERVLLRGVSGSGKSTLLLGLAGLLDAAEGEERGCLLVGGESAGVSRGRVGLLLQDPDSQLVFSRVGDEVAFGPENLGVSREEIWRRVREVLEFVGLPFLLSADSSRLSGGLKQRLALAGVLAMRPGVLLLDEPCASLDPVGVGLVRDAVLRVADELGLTLLVADHRPQTWRRLVDREICLAAPGYSLAGRVSGVGSAGVVADAGGGVGGGVSAVIDLGGGCAGVDVAGGVRGAGVGAVCLRVEGLGVSRVAGEVLLRGVDFSLRAGEIVAVTGVNGSGKSTLALTLAGLLPPVAGRVVAGRGESVAVHEFSAGELVSRVGMVFQDPEHQFVADTVRKELCVGSLAAGRSVVEADARAVELARAIGLDTLLPANPFTLSGGEKRRLSVATALAAAPDVLILDEPTFGQDPVTWRAVVGLLREVAAAGCAVVAITHDEEFVREVADRVFVVAGGRVREVAGSAGLLVSGSVAVAGAVDVAPVDVAGVDVERADAASAGAAAADAAKTVGESADVSSAGLMPGGSFSRARLKLNPLTLFAGPALLAVAVVVSIDWVSAVVALTGFLLFLPVLGLPVRLLAARSVPIVLAAVMSSVTIALYGRPSGRVFFEFWFAQLSEGSLVLAVATFFRVLAVGLPAVVGFLAVDLTELADALTSRVRLPARFVLGAVGALRLVSAFFADWQSIALARRARGVSGRGRFGRFFGQAFALLVVAVRRGATLATAMEARGLGGSARRVSARVSRFGLADVLTFLFFLFLAVFCVWTAISAGVWRPIFVGGGVV